VHTAGFKAHNLPLPQTPVVDASIAVVSADIALPVRAFKIGLRSDDSRIAVDADLEIGEIKLADLDGPCPALGQSRRLRFNRAVGADADIVVRQQMVHLADVIGDDCLPPLHFQGFDFLVGGVVLVMGQRICLLGKGKAQSREKQKAGHGPVKGARKVSSSAHVRIGW
jgi:hypothetical protein